MPHCLHKISPPPSFSICLLDMEAPLGDHPVLWSVAIFTFTTLYFRIQILLNEKKRASPRYGGGGPMKAYSAEDITVASTFSSSQTSRPEDRDLRSKLQMCEKVIESLQSELKSSANGSQQIQASLESERVRAAVMEEESKETKQLLEKERAKVLRLQSAHTASKTESHELEWDKASTMIDLVKVQKKVHEIEAQISFNRLSLINKKKILEVERNKASIDELVGARADAEKLLMEEQRKIQESHRALEESICIIEENQEKLSGDQFEAFDEQERLKKEVKKLETSIRAKDSLAATQKQQIIQLQRLNEAERKKAENQQTASQMKLEALERKLQAATKEVEYQTKRYDDLKELHNVEKQRADILQGDQSKTNEVVRMKNTKIDSLEMKIKSLQENEVAHQKQVQNLQKLHTEAMAKATRQQTEETRLLKEKMDCENALEKMNLKMEDKLETISKLKNQIERLEKMHAEEKNKSDKINQQLPQLLDLITAEETKGLKLQEQLQETKDLLQSEKSKVESLEKELGTLSSVTKTRVERIEQLERDRFNRLMKTNQPDQEQTEKKGWFWKQ
eukprot:scaffold9548_cov108-Cylindrotheca_fusiformis.AAC.5